MAEMAVVAEFLASLVLAAAAAVVVDRGGKVLAQVVAALAF
jgi:hypothetical protein